MELELKNINREKLDANSVVFRAGDSGNAAYVIQSGCVEVLIHQDGVEKRVAVLFAGINTSTNSCFIILFIFL